MSGKPGDPSPAQIARANRMRLAAEEGARAMEEATKEAIAVRKNMARLRELRWRKKRLRSERRSLSEMIQTRKLRSDRSERGRLSGRPLH
jgi:hypothetical protein